MSTLEELVYDRLAASEAVTALLAQVDTDKPAIFVEQAPDSSSKRWVEPAEQTPRVVLTVQRIEDPARGSDATLLVDLFGLSDALPALSAAVQAALSGVYFHPTSEPPLAIRVPSAMPDPALAAYASIDDALALSFDVLAFPPAAVFAPDPVTTLQEWAADTLVDDDDKPQVQVDPSAWDADEALPALYCSLRSQRLLKRWPTKFQWQAEVRLHLLHRDVTTREAMARRLAQALAQTPDLRMGQGWLTIDRPLVADFAADPFRTGQVSFTAEFWTAKPPSAAQKIERVELSGQDLPTVEVPAAV